MNGDFIHPATDIFIQCRGISYMNEVENQRKKHFTLIPSVLCYFSCIYHHFNLIIELLYIFVLISNPGSFSPPMHVVYVVCCPIAAKCAFHKRLKYAIIK